MKRTLLILTCTLIALTVGAALATAGDTLESAWDRFSERHDGDGDGVVTADEFASSDRRFLALDADQSGTIDPDELAQAETRCDNPPAPGSGLIRLADSDRDHELTREEWDALAVELDGDGDGLITDSELIETMIRNRPRRPGGRQEGPGAGGPDFEPRPLTDRMDTNEDGLFDNGDLDQIFSELDKDGDLVVSSDEMPAFPFGPRQRGRCGSESGFGARPGAFGPDGAPRGGRFAGSPGGPDFLPMHRADADRNGEITLDEWNTYLDDFDRQGVFDALDANGDQILTADEMPVRRRGPKPPPAK